MDNISVVGAVKFNSKDAEELDESKALELWKELTKNQPEQKGVLNHIFKKETYKDLIPLILLAGRSNAIGVLILAK